MRPRRLVGASGRPLNFTVRRRAHTGSNVIIASRPLRFLTALASSVLIGVVTMLLIGFVLPWAIGALRNRILPDAQLEMLSWMLLFVPVGAIVSLSVVSVLLVRFYDRLGGGQAGSPSTSSNNRWRGP